VKPDYEYVIKYNKPLELIFIAAACVCDQDLLWKSKYTQVIERANNYVSKHCKPKLSYDDCDDYMLSCLRATQYASALSLISGGHSYIDDIKQQIHNLIDDINDEKTIYIS
jgi:hypothetical protein